MPATMRATLCATRLIRTDDDLQPLAGRGLIVDRMAVHDRERRRLDDAFALALGYPLPRIALLRRIQLNAIRLQTLGVRRGERAERLEASAEGGRHGRIIVYRRNPGQKIHAALVLHEQRTQLHTSEILERADVRAEVGPQSVDRRRAAVELTEPGVLHR